VVVRSRGDDELDETLSAVVTAAWQALDAGQRVEAVDFG
jgi:hypothetical protein